MENDKLSESQCSSSFQTIGGGRQVILSPSGEKSVLSPGSIDFVFKKENAEPVADFEVKFVSLESKKEDDDEQEDLVAVAPYKIQQEGDNDDSQDIQRQKIAVH